jgi:hypothetical protein
MKKVLHLCPKNSLFAQKVAKIAEDRGEEFYLYETSYKYFCKEEIASIASALKGRSGYELVFHRAPSLTIFLMTLRFPGLRYAVFYWGDDYYVPILPVRRLTQHCLSRSRFRDRLLENFPDDFTVDPWLESLKRSRPLFYLWRRLTQQVARLIAIHVAGSSTTIYSSPKQYRYARFLGRKLLRARSFCRRNELMTLYSEVDLEPGKVGYAGAAPLDAIRRKRELNVMVCHSATSDVNVPHSLCLLEYLSRNSDIRINITGYLSYSGGGDSDRDAIERSYVALASRFAGSVRFERRYLSSSQLRESFDHIDVAFISAYRDEGLTLLGMLSQHGGLLCFNRRSINYDYFRAKKYPGLMSHEAFIDAMRSE